MILSLNYREVFVRLSIEKREIGKSTFPPDSSAREVKQNPQLTILLLITLLLSGPEGPEVGPEPALGRLSTNTTTGICGSSFNDETTQTARDPPEGAPGGRLAPIYYRYSRSDATSMGFWTGLEGSQAG